jgi:hypothetical protein
MSFNPLAFTNPQQFFTFDGAVSWAMFMSFMTDNEVAQSQFDCDDTSLLENTWDKSEERLHLIVDNLNSKKELLDALVHTERMSAVIISDTYCEIVACDQNGRVAHSAYKLLIDDGAPLTMDQLAAITEQIEQKIEEWFPYGLRLYIDDIGMNFGYIISIFSTKYRYARPDLI